MGTPTSAPLDEESISQAYAALERLYSEGRWSDAEAAGKALLAKDPGVSAHWRERVLLVLGHTQLYGLADPAAAAALYQQVLELGSDPMLRDIAAAGLAQCQPVSAPEPPPARPDATPWLTESLADATADAPPGRPELEAPSPGQAAETLFSGFVQPVQIAETAQTDFPPQQMVGEQVQEQLQKHPEQQLEEPSSQPLSPEDQAELALGLLRVVIQAN
jgi:hypothetical protein